jgi:hypothetical protein
LAAVKPDLYTFRIDSFTPDTLPMARLAQYLAELAALLGESDRVHFRELKRGSAQVVAAVESVAAPKVLQRVKRAESADLDDEVRASFENLNTLLAEDNAVGTIKRGTAVILKFPGREQPLPEKIGPFSQQTELIGQLVRIGGKDKTSHATIEDADGRYWPVTLSRELARQLSSLLYGPPIRMSGVGRWSRLGSGEWELDDMRLQTWEQLPETTLREGITALRGLPASDWEKEQEPAALLKKIRRGDDEVH